jgi:hypothetical protein
MFHLLVDSKGIDAPWGRLNNSKGERDAKEWVGWSYKPWKQWTGYLVCKALIPNKQLFTDDFCWRTRKPDEFSTQRHHRH